MAQGSKKVVLLALSANMGIAVAKFVAFFLTASASLLAEAIHSLADTGNQLLLLLGMKKAAKPPDGRHPFGYKMESYFWSFIVAVMLFALGGLFALYEGVHKVRSRSVTPSMRWVGAPPLAQTSASFLVFELWGEPTTRIASQAAPRWSASSWRSSAWAWCS